jgi:hypothetical protein
MSQIGVDPCEASTSDRRVTIEHATDVCKIGQGNECCRYLIGSPKGLECAKNIIRIRRFADMRVADEDMVARGDNCEGLGNEDHTGCDKPVQTLEDLMRGW